MINFKKHPALTHVDDLQIICKPLRALGIEYFSHANISNKGELVALGINPGFTQVYFENQYYNYDIHMANSRLEEQFILWDTIERDKGSKDLYDDFMHFQLGHTFTIVETNKDSKDCYHFAGKLQDESINCKYLQNIDLLKKFILYFKENVQKSRELKHAYDFKFKIDLDNSGYFLKENLSNAEYNEFLNSIHHETIPLDFNKALTKREVECLHWQSLGKTAEEVGMILSITPRTVKAHIRNIKDKLSCSNQFQMGLFYCKFKSLMDVEI